MTIFGEPENLDDLRVLANVEKKMGGTHYTELYKEKWEEFMKQLESDTKARKEAKRKNKEIQLIEMQVRNQNKIIKLLESTKLKEQNETKNESLPENFDREIGAVTLEFTQFKIEFSDLRENGFIIFDKEHSTIGTPYGKPFVYDYFKLITPKNKNTKWSPVEKLFKMQNLRLSRGSRSMLSTGMENWIKLKKLDREAVITKVLYSQKED